MREKIKTKQKSKEKMDVYILGISLHYECQERKIKIRKMNITYDHAIF